MLTNCIVDKDAKVVLKHEVTGNEENRGLSQTQR